MGLVDIFIPLVLGLFSYFGSATLIKDSVPNYEKKRSAVQKCGIALLVVAGIFAVIKIATD